MRIRDREVSGFTELIPLMERQLAAFDRRGDHRAAFLRVYTRMTHRVRERAAGSERTADSQRGVAGSGRPADSERAAGTQAPAGPGFFLDPRWVEAVAIRFAGYYFTALDAFKAGRPCPPAWRRAFAAAAGGRTTVLQDVLLGINAHINNDLPQVLADLLPQGDWPHLDRLVRRRFDHDQINRILDELVPIVEGEIARHYARLLRPLGLILGRLDDLLAAYGLKFYRDAVWHKALALVACPPGPQRQRVRHWVEADALAIASHIEGLLPPGWTTRLVRWARRRRLF